MLVLFPVLFIVSGIRRILAGRFVEGRTFLFMGLAIPVSLALFAALPVWQDEVLFGLESLIALAEAVALVTWPATLRRAGPTEQVIDDGGRRWKGMALVAIGSALGFAVNVLDAGTLLSAVPLGLIAVLSGCLAVIDARVGSRVTANGLLQGMRFTPWADVIGSRLEADGLTLFVRTRLQRWLGPGWRKMRGERTTLLELEARVERGLLE